MSIPIDSLMDAILHRATLDREFRAKLLASPSEAVREAFGVEVPAAVSVRFVERDPSADLTLVLPDFDQDGELSDEDLDAAAGGFDQWVPPPAPPPGGTGGTTGG
ncbi:MAG TPA: NHLP leader peptide family RiPP precursor [Longimicrobium sp.]|jgi:hypothetical protein